MIKGIWYSLSGLVPRMFYHDVSANNLANITTSGYKADKAFLKSFVDAEMAAQANSDKYYRLSEVEEVKTNFSQGLFEQTENPLDVAIMGDGFFCLSTPNGEVYTRNGNFKLDKNYQLVTSDNKPVLGSNNRPIKLSEGEIFFTEKGEIIINGQIVAQLKIVDFPKPYNLRKAENNCFATMDNTVLASPAKDFQIKHGFLERSNVNSVQEMLNMVIYFRNYEADTRILTAQDDTLRLAANEIGKPI
jgi:flagellar basal-body rod protein FlgG